MRVECLWNTPDAVVSTMDDQAVNNNVDEDDDAAQVAAMQVTAVVDGMLASPMDPGMSMIGAQYVLADIFIIFIIMVCVNHWHQCNQPLLTPGEDGALVKEMLSGYKVHRLQ